MDCRRFFGSGQKPELVPSCSRSICFVLSKLVLDSEIGGIAILKDTQNKTKAPPKRFFIVESTPALSLLKNRNVSYTNNGA